MKRKRCIVCGRPTSDGIVVCPSCAKGLGEPKRARTEDVILSFKIERRR